MPVALGSGFISSRLGLQAAANAAGDVFVVGHGGFSIFGARFDAAADDWQPAESLEFNSADNDGTSESPRITMDANGNATVVWHRVKWSDFWDAYVGDADVWTMRYTRP